MTEPVVPAQDSLALLGELRRLQLRADGSAVRPGHASDEAARAATRA